MNIAEFRAKHPEYNDLPEWELGPRLHQKFYSDLEYEDFAGRFEISQPTPPANLDTLEFPGEERELGTALAIERAQQLSTQPDADAYATVGDAIKAGQQAQFAPLPLESHERVLDMTVRNAPVRSYAPGAEPTPFRRTMDRLFGNPDEVTPDSETGALLAYHGAPEGMTAQQYADTIGGPVGIAERVAGDVGAGALRTVEGGLGFAGRLMDDPAIRSAGIKVGEAATDLMPAQPGFGDQLAAGVGSMLTFWIPGAGIARGVAAGQKAAGGMASVAGASTATLLEAGAEAGSVYEGLRAQGLNHDEASEKADMAFAQNLALLYATNKAGLFSEGGHRAMQTARTAALEGAQEAGQAGISNYATGKPLTEGMAEGAAIGALVGGGVKGVTAKRSEGEELKKLLSDTNVAINELEGQDVGDMLAAAARLEPAQPQTERAGGTFRNLGAVDADAGIQTRPVQATEMSLGTAPPETAVAPGADPRARTAVSGGAAAPPFPAGTAATAGIGDEGLAAALGADVETSPQDADAATLPPNYQDPRLSRTMYREALEAMPGQLEAGGGTVLIPRDGAVATSDTGDLVYDYGADQLVRSPSTNPGWFKNNGWTKKQVQRVVDLALAGKKLGPRQVEVLDALLATIQGDRQSAVPTAQAERDNARRLRRVFGPEFQGAGRDYDALWTELYGDEAQPGQIYEADEYLPGYTDEVALTLQELGNQAQELDSDGYVALLEGMNAAQLADDAAMARTLLDFIAENRNAGQTEEIAGTTARRNAAQGPGASASQAEPEAQGGAAAPGGQVAALPQGDMFGRNETEQALADRVAELERKAREAPDMDQGAGNLFSDANRQTDIADAPSPAESSDLDTDEDRSKRAARANYDLVQSRPFMDSSATELRRAIAYAGNRIASAQNRRARGEEVRDDEVPMWYREIEFLQTELNRRRDDATPKVPSSASAQNAPKSGTSEAPASGKEPSDLPNAGGSAAADTKQPTKTPAKPRAVAAPDAAVDENTDEDTETSPPEAVLLSRSPGASPQTAVSADAGGASVEAQLNAAGAAYVPFVEQLPLGPVVESTPRSQHLSDPKRREEILEQYLKDLGLTIYQGRVRGKGVQGFFKPATREIRIKRRNDLETAAHEIAHYLDYTNLELREKWKRDPWRAELRGVSYDRTKTHEGFAEWMRLWMTQPAEALSRAPQWTTYFEAWLENDAPPHVRTAVGNARTAMREWFDQPATVRMASKIGGREIRQGNTAALAQFRQAISDDLSGILEMEKDITGEMHAAAGGIYENARLTRATMSILDSAIVNGAPVANFEQRGDERVLTEITHQGMGLEEVLSPISEEMDDFILYAVSVSAAELKAQGRENLFTAEEIAAGLALNNGRQKDANGRTDFERAFDNYQKWNKGIVDFAESLGIINPASRAKWRRQMYIPFYRLSTPGATQRTGGVEGNVTAVHRLTGGTGNLRDILGNMIQNAEMLITHALRNEARRRVADLGSSRPEGGKWLAKIPKETKPAEVMTDQVRGHMYDAMGLPRAAMNPQGVARAGLSEEEQLLAEQIDTWAAEEGAVTPFWMFNQTPTVKTGDQVFAVMRDGQPTFYEVADPTLWKALSQLQRKTRKMARDVDDFWERQGTRVSNAAVGARRFGQMTITMSIDFMTANLWRDTWHGWVFSRSGFIPGLDSARGMAMRIPDTALDPLAHGFARPVIEAMKAFKERYASNAVYQQWRSNGGDMASYLTDEDALRSDLERFYQRRGLNLHYIADTPRRIWRMLEQFGSAFETATRLGEYQRAIDKGLTPREAAYRAREVSTDFSMRGDSDTVGWLYDRVLFLKAAVNGIDRAARGLGNKIERGGVFAKSAAVIGVSVALYLMNRGIKCYDDLPDWDKDAHWHVFIPKPGAGKGDCEQDYTHWRMPKIWEIGAAASMAERGAAVIIDALSGKDVDNWKTARNMGGIVRDQFKFDYLPFIIEPLAEVYLFNEERFYGRDIVPPSLEKLPPAMQSTAYTSATIRSIGEASAFQPELMRDAAEKLTGDRSSWEISPKRMEALWRGYTNTWGLYMLMATDTAMFGAQLPERKWTELPGVRRFAARKPGRVQAEQDFYEFWRQAQSVSDGVRAGAKRGSPELAELYARDPRLIEKDFTTAMLERIREYNAAQQQIYRDPTMTPKEKRDGIDAIARKKNELFIGAVKGIKEGRKVRKKQAAAAAAGGTP